jgi:hypothetical protein
MKITSATNLQWGNPEHTYINMNVTFEHTGDDLLPFTANQNDTEAHGKDIFNRAVSGEWGSIADYVEPVDTRTYAQKRQSEYPAIGDQLDALFHAGVFPLEMAAQIQAVKDKYPKG